MASLRPKTKDLFSCLQHDGKIGMRRGWWVKQTRTEELSNHSWWLGEAGHDIDIMSCVVFFTTLNTLNK